MPSESSSAQDNQLPLPLIPDLLSFIVDDPRSCHVSVPMNTPGSEQAGRDDGACLPFDGTWQQGVFTDNLLIGPSTTYVLLFSSLLLSIRTGRYSFPNPTSSVSPLTNMDSEQ